MVRREDTALANSSHVGARLADAELFAGAMTTPGTIADDLAPEKVLT
jgi:hypothetical protein